LLEVPKKEDEKSEKKQKKPGMMANLLQNLKADDSD